MSYSRLLDGNIHTDTMDMSDFTYGSVVVSAKDENSGELKWSVLEPPYPDTTNYASCLQYKKSEGSIDIIWGKMKIAVSYDTNKILAFKEIAGDNTSMFDWYDFPTQSGTAKRIGLHNDIAGGYAGFPSLPNHYYGTDSSGTLGWYSFEGSVDTSTHKLLDPPSTGLHEDTLTNEPERGALVVGVDENNANKWSKLVGSSTTGHILTIDDANLSWGSYGTDEQNVVIFDAASQSYQLTSSDIDTAAQNLYFGTDANGTLGWHPLPDPPPCGGGGGDPGGAAKPCLTDHVMLNFKRGDKGIYVTMRLFFSHPIKAIPGVLDNIDITIAYQEDDPNSYIVITASVPKNSIITGTSSFDFTFDDIPPNIEVLKNFYISRIDPEGHLVNANTGEPVDISPPNCRPVKTYRLSTTKPPGWPEGAPFPPFPEEPPPPEPTGNCDPPPTIVVTDIWVKDFFIFARAKASRFVRGSCVAPNGAFVDGQAVSDMLWFLFSNQQGSQELIGISKIAVPNSLTPGVHRVCVSTCSFQCWDNPDISSGVVSACVEIVMGGGADGGPGQGDGVPKGKPQPADNPGGGGGGGGGKNDKPGALPLVPPNCQPGGGGGGGAPGGGSTVITLNRDKSFVVYKSAGIFQVVNIVPRNFQNVPNSDNVGEPYIAWIRNAGEACVVRGGRGISLRVEDVANITRQIPVVIPASGSRVVHRTDANQNSSQFSPIISAAANVGVVANQLAGGGQITSGVKISGAWAWSFDYTTNAFDAAVMVNVGGAQRRCLIETPIAIDAAENESGILPGPIALWSGVVASSWTNDVVYPLVYEYNQTILTVVGAGGAMQQQDIWTEDNNYNAQITFQYNRYWL